MNDFNRAKDGPNPAPIAERDLDATVRWLRGLTATEMDELRRAMANHDTESLAMFAIRFATCLDLTRRS